MIIHLEHMLSDLRRRHGWIRGCRLLHHNVAHPCLHVHRGQRIHEDSDKVDVSDKVLIQILTGRNTLHDVLLDTLGTSMHAHSHK